VLATLSLSCPICPTGRTRLGRNPSGAAWAAKHRLHDLDGSSEHAHDAIMAAHNIAETVELIEMLEHSK